MSFDLQSSAELLRVLAHSTRLAVLKNLSGGPKCVTDINKLLDVSQPNLSQHLALLRREGVIDFFERGKQRCYYITHPAMVEGLMSFLTKEYPVSVSCREDVCHITTEPAKTDQKSNEVKE